MTHDKELAWQPQTPGEVDGFLTQGQGLHPGACENFYCQLLVAWQPQASVCGRRVEGGRFHISILTLNSFKHWETVIRVRQGRRAVLQALRMGSVDLKRDTLITGGCQML